MRTLEFKARMTNEMTLAVPEHLAAAIPDGEDLHVILLLESPGDPDQADSDAWRNLSARNLLEAYAPEDSIYDRLYADPNTR